MEKNNYIFCPFKEDKNFIGYTLRADDSDSLKYENGLHAYSYKIIIYAIVRRTVKIFWHKKIKDDYYRVDQFIIGSTDHLDPHSTSSVKKGTIILNDPIEFDTKTIMSYNQMNDYLLSKGITESCHFSFIYYWDQDY